MVVASTALPTAPPRRSSLTCSGCAGSVPTRHCLVTGARQHEGAGFVIACSADLARTQPLPRDWFVPAAAVQPVTPPMPSAAVVAESRASTQRISFVTAAELAKWVVA